MRFFATYTCVRSCFEGFLFPSIWLFSYKRAYICAKKKLIYMRYKQACVYVVTESWRIRDTELYRQQKPLHVQWSWKVTLVCIKHGRNGRVNFAQGLVLIHCPNSSGSCWFPDDGFVGICGLSLETQAAQAHYMNADVTLACERCCVTNGYLQRFVWDVNGFS